MILYHGTSDYRVKTIMRRGLQPGKERHCNVRVFGRRVRAICLTPNPYNAVLWANRKCNQYGGKPVVLKIDTRNLDVQKPLSCNSRDDERYYFDPISAKRIMTVRPVEVVTKKEIIDGLGKTRGPFQCRCRRLQSFD